jgi:hypothetical protein
MSASGPVTCAKMPVATSPYNFTESDNTMHDPRLDKLASTLINHSTKLQAGEHVLIEAFDIPSP